MGRESQILFKLKKYNNKILEDQTNEIGRTKGFTQKPKKIGKISNMVAELHKFGILVSRIPEISGRKSGHFQINATNLSIFGIKNLQ